MAGLLPFNDTNYEKVKSTQYHASMKSHAVFGSLHGPTMIERFDVHRAPSFKTKMNEVKSNDTTTQGQTYSEFDKLEVTVGSIDIGAHLVGNDGIVHGGIISMLFDEMFGWGCHDVMNYTSITKDFVDPIVVTANLSVDFRAPLPVSSSVVIRIYCEKISGKKLFLKATMQNQKGTILYSEAKSLFIIVDKHKLNRKTTHSNTISSEK
mmetsp:Transcript_16480/g.23435  ORF Transcript_16480/g.23435 Transcript_16480/m.23435 type:complete len:208 (+) Transcript_16480:113-736(+)|eukprot:CAMPEP_0184866558 /NCGR_PEP_ID=MMETSP0580-20130426/22790_1 /TAXON_ID=1118495 /ORGANISM="Dactyliosolen fragilissimus" /LENGTH=207 /DNA_ID=CAMNT_0027366297 /DNA_START=34 /DNA_END=657 /DNA_ORIENTATION=+